MITPYNAEAFQLYLDRLGLTQEFPDLVHSLLYGFKIGVPRSLLADNIIPPYFPSDGDVRIDEYLEEEIVAGRMSGPFTREELEKLLGTFAASPVHVIETVDDEGNPKYRVVRNFSWVGRETGYSVNDLIDSDEFPTEWGTASKVAGVVSPFLCLCFL